MSQHAQLPLFEHASLAQAAPSLRRFLRGRGLLRGTAEACAWGAPRVVGGYDLDPQLTQWARGCVGRAATEMEAAEEEREAKVDDSEAKRRRAAKWRGLASELKVATCDVVERSIMLRTPRALAPNLNVPILMPVVPADEVTAQVPLGWGRVGPSLYLPLPHGPKMLRALAAGLHELMHEADEPPQPQHAAAEPSSSSLSSSSSSSPRRSAKLVPGSQPKRAQGGSSTAPSAAAYVVKGAGDAAVADAASVEQGPMTAAADESPFANLLRQLGAAARKDADEEAAAAAAATSDDPVVVSSQARKATRAIGRGGGGGIGEGGAFAYGTGQLFDTAGDGSAGEAATSEDWPRLGAVGAASGGGPGRREVRVRCELFVSPEGEISAVAPAPKYLLPEGLD